MKAVNSNLYKNITPEILEICQKWLIQQTKQTDKVVKGEEWPTVQEWTTILESWLPMLESFERVKSVSEAQVYQQIIQYLNNLVIFGINKMLKSFDECQEGGFDQDDTFEEHIESSNSKSIKEILKPLLQIGAITGSPETLEYFASKL
jgi:hypothetical protein